MTLADLLAFQAAKPAKPVAVPPVAPKPAEIAADSIQMPASRDHRIVFATILAIAQQNMATGYVKNGKEFPGTALVPKFLLRQNLRDVELDAPIADIVDDLIDDKFVRRVETRTGTVLYIATCMDSAAPTVKSKGKDERTSSMGRRIAETIDALSETVAPVPVVAPVAQSAGRSNRKRTA